MRGADPSIVRANGSYYLVQSHDTAIVMYQAARLEDLGRARPVTVWTPPDSGWNHAEIWAPELAHLGGRWYTFDPRNHGQRRIGRTVIGRGRDAADVAMTTTFGSATLLDMQVTAEAVA